MKVELSSTVYQITWQHFNYQNTSIEKMSQTSVKFSQTRCFIVNIATNIVVAEGQAILSAKDNYNRNKGRKISLRKALTWSSFLKAERKLIWLEYFKMRGEKW